MMIKVHYSVISREWADCTDHQITCRMTGDNNAELSGIAQLAVTSHSSSTLIATTSKLLAGFLTCQLSMYLCLTENS